MKSPLYAASNLSSTSSTSGSHSSSSSAATTTSNPWLRQLDKRLWRAIDLLHIIVMFFSLYTAIVVAILRNELFEQCPLYAKLYLRDNATRFSTDAIGRRTVWGSVYTCEFASFAYLSAFVLSFISLWIHVVFRRVVRTERLLRLPIGLLTFFFALLTVLASSIVTDGVVKFCSNSPGNICASSGAAIFSPSRWKIISLPVGGWLTTLSILLNVLVRGIQLFSKPKKSPETLKTLLGQLMAQKHQHKLEKETNDYGSQFSSHHRERFRSQHDRRDPVDLMSNRSLSPGPYPYRYPPVPEYRRIEKRSRFQRICCPCFHRRRRRRPPRSFPDPYRPFVVPEQYTHRLNPVKDSATVPGNTCHHHSVQQSQTPRRRSLDETTDEPFLGRRRSSVRFEDELPLVKIPDPPAPTVPKVDAAVTGKKETEVPVSTPGPDLQRNVSFRNNEDDLWTTVTVNQGQSASVQSSHFNRLPIENLSHVDTSLSNGNNGVTAIHVNSKPIDSASSETVQISPPPAPPLPSFKTTWHRPTTTTTIRHKPTPPPLSSRSHTASSEDDADLRHVKPVEEINTIVANKYSYNDLSQALKSNVERLKSTFIQAQENPADNDKPRIVLKTISGKCHTENHSSD